MMVDMFRLDKPVDFFRRDRNKRADDEMIMVRSPLCDSTHQTWRIRGTAVIGGVSSCW